MTTSCPKWACSWRRRKVSFNGFQSIGSKQMSFNVTLNRNPARSEILMGAYPNGDAPVVISETLLADFGDGWIMNGVLRAEHTSGIWNTLDTGHADQEMSIVAKSGGGGNALQIDVTAYGNDGLYKHYIAYEESHNNTLDAPKGHNRFVMLCKMPTAGGSNVHTFHLGTYSEDPDNSVGSSLGNHWYHYYRFRGNDAYFMKVYMDERATHVVGNSSSNPPTNPTSGDGFDYFDGFTRLYWQMAYSPFQSSFPGPYVVQVADLKFYTEPRVENEFSINNVVVSYFGGGEFDVDWTSWSPYERRVEVFDVRYSLTPIETLADFTAASVVPGQPAEGWGHEFVGHHDNHIRANFVIPGMNEAATYYFAIQDTYSGHTNALKRVDYNVQEINGV